MRHRSALVLAALLVLAVACGDDGSAVGTSPGEAEPWGRTFLTAGPPPVRIGFTDDRQVTAQADCNHLGGAARIEDGVLVVEQMGGTEMGCDAERHAYDEWLAAFLASSPTFGLDGDTLTLTAGEDTLVLVDREVADPDRPFVATEWVVDGVVTGDAVSSIPVGVEAALRFTEFRVEGSTGCNSFGGEVTIADGAIGVGALTTTDVACADDVMAVEEAIFATLTGSVTYEVDAASLRLTGPDGHGLTLRAA